MIKTIKLKLFKKMANSGLKALTFHDLTKLLIQTSFRATVVSYIGKSGIVEAYSMLIFFYFLFFLQDCAWARKLDRLLVWMVIGVTMRGAM